MKIMYILLGILLIVLGVSNCMGNINTVHRYHRNRVSEEDKPKYGKVIGTGTIIIGASIIVTETLRMFTDSPALYWITGVGMTAGIGFMLFGQIKYNKGIF